MALASRGRACLVADTALVGQDQGVDMERLEDKKNQEEEKELVPRGGGKDTFLLVGDQKARWKSMS